QVDGEVLQALVVLGLEELGDRSLRARLLAGTARGPGSEVRHLDQPAFDDRSYQPVSEHGVAPGPRALGLAHQVVDRTAADVGAARATRTGQRGPLVHERRRGHRPSLALRSEA